MQQLKSTFIVLVPKGENTCSPDRCRPISLTNELYMFIHHILVGRLKPIISRLVGHMQSTFIHGRSIANNIHLSHDILQNFHRISREPRMCLKLDLAKAYDSVRWDFLETALHCM